MSMFQHTPSVALEQFLNGNQSYCLPSISIRAVNVLVCKAKTWCQETKFRSMKVIRFDLTSASGWKMRPSTSWAICARNFGPTNYNRIEYEQIKDCFRHVYKHLTTIEKFTLLPFAHWISPKNPCFVWKMDLDSDQSDLSLLLCFVHRSYDVWYQVVREMVSCRHCHSKHSKVKSPYTSLSLFCSFTS